MPGKTHIYEFTAHQSGTYFYHSGFNISKQEMYGLAGLFIIHPQNYEHKIDRHIAILLQEWALLPGNMYPNLLTTNFNWFTFNGRAAPSIPIINLKQGERTRIHLGNMVMDSHPIHIHGYTWNVVGTEGGPIQKSAQWKGSTINVAPGETRTVEFVAWNPGPWPFHCHKMHHVMNAHAEVPMGIMPHGGMFTFVNVIPAKPSTPWRHPGQTKPDRLDVDAYGFNKTAPTQTPSLKSKHGHGTK
jgi:FtsP/CotA-like multicopper oxidase with cupredoxin domain